MSHKNNSSLVNSFALICAGLLVLAVVSDANAYTYNNLGGAGGWDDVQKGSSVSYVLDRSDYTSDSGLSENQITSVLTSAFDTWGSVVGSGLKFVANADLGGNYDLLDGPSDGPPWFGGYAGDSFDQSANYLHSNITFGGWLPNDYFDYLEDGSIDGRPSNILGVTWTGKIRGPLSKKPQWVADVFLNDRWTWNIGGDLVATPEYEIDIETVVLHELGHAIGLGHEDSVPSVMGTYFGGVDDALYADDEAAVLSLYPTKGGGKDDGGGGGHGGGKPPWAGGGFSFFTIDDYLAMQSVATVPEPGMLTLLAIGGPVLLGRLRRRK